MITGKSKIIIFPIQFLSCELQTLEINWKTSSTKQESFPVVTSPQERILDSSFWFTKMVEHVFARVEKETGDIYAKSGLKARGNLLTSPLGGIEFVDAYGVIVNNEKLIRRLQDFSPNALIKLRILGFIIP